MEQPTPQPNANGTSSYGGIERALDAIARALLAPFSNISWTPWTPTISASTGAFTTASGTGAFIRLGKTVHFRADLTITTIGTGTGCVFSLPIAPISSQTLIGYAREDATSGNMGVIKQAGNFGTVIRYDNGNITSGGSGSIVRVLGSYEVA